MRGVGLSQGCDKNAQRYICRHNMQGKWTKERGRTLVRTPTRPLKNKDIQGITIPGILQQGLGIEVVLLDVLEIVEGAYLEFLASRLVADDDTMLVHL